jgi:hypothetical protein
MFSPATIGVNDAEATSCLYYSSKACAIRPWRRPPQRRFTELVALTPASGILGRHTTDDGRRNFRENILAPSAHRAAARAEVSPSLGALPCAAAKV